MIIMVVEDEFTTAMDLERILSDAGHVVLHPVSEAIDAIEMAEKSLPDLAIVDIGLRDGPVGLPLARYLNSRWGIPVIFVTASVPDARASPTAIGVIAKPFTTSSVMRSVDEAMQRMHR
jgi:CheY-like chemotaxis protein